MVSGVGVISNQAKHQKEENAHLNFDYFFSLTFQGRVATLYVQRQDMWMIKKPCNKIKNKAQKPGKP